MKSLNHLNKYFIKYKYRFILGVFFVIVSNVFGVIPAQVIRYAFDIVKESVEVYRMYDGFKLQKNFYSIFNYCLFFFGGTVLLLAILRGIFLFFMRQTMIVMSRMIEYDLKNEIYQHLQSLSASYFKKNNTGDLMARVGEDVTRVRMYIGPAIMYAINVIVLFVLVVATMISVNPTLTFYVLLPLPILAVAIYIVTSIINKKSERIQEQLSKLSTFSQETFSGIRVIKSYVKEIDSSARFDKESVEYKSRSLELAKVQSTFFPLMIVLVGLSTLITIYVGGIEVMEGTITPGNIAEFVVYVNLLTWPVSAIGWVTSLIQRAAASQERINEILKISSEIKSTQKIISNTIEGKIEFKNVSFVYPDTGVLAIHGISFKVNSGKSLAIIGRTGSGKSTIANLILRFYDVNHGSILIDGCNIKENDLNQLRQHIGYVPQDVFLFSDTIANNISFGLQEETLNENQILKAMQKAAVDAGVQNDINRFKDGFQTLIGERGVTLSGGQKQRISIARAAIKNPKILIFDDCLSSVDTKTEEIILKGMKNMMKNRTTIIIGHRISTVKHADEIIVLDNGKIVEIGNHESLISGKSFYYQLYKKQLFEEEFVN